METFVWQIPWLSCAGNGYITTSMPAELSNTKVSELMEVQEKIWDEDILNDLFNARDVRLIKQIPLSSRDRRDTWMWMFDGKGEFTVKSCYRQLVGEYSTPDAAFWKKIRNLELPGKVRFFLWRTCRQCLPTAMALIDKRVDIDSKCCWCRVENEDAKHALFECNFAHNVWTAAGMAHWVQTTQGETILEHFKRLFSNGTNEQCVSLALFCWSIWNRRNKWVWNRIEVSVFGTTSAAMNLLADWKAVQVERTRATTAPSLSIRRWQVPQRSWVKINVDAATFGDSGTIGVGGVIRDEHGNFLKAMCKQVAASWSPKINVDTATFGDTGTIGVGGVIRDEHGNFLKAMCKQVAGSWSPREAEALSLKEVLSWTKRFDFARCMYDTDSKLLVDACNGIPGRSYFHSIVEDCVELFKHFEDVLVHFVHRSANEVAHLLARVSHSMSGLREWEDAVPNFL